MSSLKAILLVLSFAVIYGSPIDPREDNTGDISNSEENPELGLFEGDILQPRFRNVVNNPNLKWPGGIVPYQINTAQYSSSDISIITSAMAEISRTTCIRFVKRTTQRDYIYISSLSGCYSYVGRIGGRQDLSLRNPGCVHRGTVMHELLHALGIWHEQSRHDRDNFIQVILANVQPGAEHNFNKLTLSTTQTFGFKYDYDSLMHYGQTAFSIDGRKPTILTKPPGIPIGQRTRLSSIDIGKVKAWYRC